MPIKPKKIRFYKGPIDPTLLLFLDARFINSYPNDGGNTFTNIAGNNTTNTGDGTISGPIWDSEEEGSFIFNGNKWIDLTSNTIAWSKSDDWTFSAYLKPELDHVYLGSTILSNSTSDNTAFSIGWGFQGFGADTPTSWSRFYIYPVGTDFLTSSRQYDINRWYYITWTKRKITDTTFEYKLYVDGILQDTFSPKANTTPIEPKLRIGKGTAGSSGGNFVGKISLVKLWQRSLSSTEVILDFISSQVKPFTLGSKSTKNDIILYLNERGTRSGWGDNSVYSNGAVIVGSATFDNGLTLPGVVSPASYGQGTLANDPGQNFTISAVFNCYGSTSNVQTIFSIPNALLGSSSPSAGFLFTLDSATRSIRFFYTNILSVSTSNNVFDFNEIINVTATVQQSGSNRIVKIYKNGQLKVTQTINNWSFSFTNKTYRIGYWITSNPNVFNGKIYNVILNNRTLSDKEVNNLYVSLPTTYKSSESSYNQEPTFGRLLYVDGAEPKSYYLTGTTFSDISGSNRNGTLTQSTVTQGITTVAGTLPTFNQFNGGHFYFNGFKTADSSNADQKGNSFIRFSPTNLPSSNSPSTIIAWARARSSQSTTVRYIFSYGLFSPAAQTRYVGIQYPNLFSVGAYGTNFGLTFSGLVIDQWFQIAFVYNGTNAFLYVNGELKNARSLSLNTITNLAASSAYIGRNNRSLTVTSDPLDGYFYGDIAQTIVYNRALTEQEIYQHYKTTRDRFGAPEVVRPISVSDIYPPQVTTINPILLNTITTTSAQSGVIINFNGNAQITESGILFRLASQTGLFEYNQPGISFISSSSGQIVNLTGLLISTGYQVRAFAYNGTSFGYGDIIDFTTGSPTALIVLAVTASFTGNYATGFGQVTDLGGAQNYTTRGFVWSNNTINVSTANNLLTRVQEVSPEPPFYTSLSEIWNLRIQQLLPATRYYLRAFAKIQNGDNVYSSNELVFTTYTFATVTITQPSSASDVQGTIAFITGNVTNGGDTPVIQRGIVWSDTNNPPTLELDSETSDGTGTGTFTGTLNGLTSNTVYYLRAYAINTAGIAYSNLIQITTDSSATITTNEMLQVLRTTATASATITDIGGATVTAKGFIWAQTTQFANPNNYTLSNVVGGQQGSVLGQVNTTPSSYTLSLSNLTANRDYFIRAYATNAIGTSYGNVVYFTTLDFGSVTTGSNTDLTTESVTLFGTITSLGGDTSGEYGFYLGTTNPPTQRVVFGDYSGTVPYDFDSIIELLLYGFSSGNTVYYRSFLKTSVPSITVGANGDYWGNVSSFVVPTPISLPTITMGTVSVFSTSNTGRFILETSRNFGFSTDTINTPIQEKGIVYGLKSSVPTPDFNNNKTIGSPSSGNGLFVATSSTLLTAAGIYTIRSYAKILDVQFVYSPVLDFVAHNIQLTVTLNGLNIDVTGDPADNPLYVYTSRGFVWNTTGDPKVENGDTISGPTSQPTTDVAPFTKTSLITNINGNTTYYVRAFVKLSNNPNMFIYSLVKTYPANPLPTVTITPESGWFDTTLSLNSLLFKVNLNIQMNGNTDQENGIVWGTSLNPTTALTTKQSVGSLVYNTTVNIYTPTFTDNTNYYFRGYTTVNGISTYSDNFAVRTIVFTDFTLTIESNYDITADATTPIATGWSIVNRGFIYTTNGQDPFAGNGVTAKTLNTSGFGAFTDTMVLSANDNTTYKARAWVDINITNSNNTVRIYSNMQEVTVSISTQVPSITLGAILDLFVDTISANKATMTAAPSGITQNPTSRGVIWSTTQNPTTSLTTKTSNGNGNSDFTQTIPPSGQNLALNTTYYLRAYAINGAGTAYSVQQTIFTRSVRLLSLTIGNKGRLEYSAEAPDLGNVIGNGVGERGIVWSTSPILIYQQNPSPTAVPNGTGNGLFNGTVIGSPVSGTTYYVRAYVEVEDFSNLIVYSNQRIYTAP